MMSRTALTLPLFLAFVSPAVADVARGKIVYDQKCAQCHGLEGAADGPAAERVNPKPRDFTSGTFKFRSTASGGMPTDEDLLRTITNGLHGTSMIGWGHVPEDDRRALVDYIKTFSEYFEEETAKPLDLGDPPEPTPEGLAEGKKLYSEMGCVSCHGQHGRGNGPSVFAQEDEGDPMEPAMFDDWDEIIYPANLTKRWTLRGGPRVEDILRALSTGLSGSPMPGYYGPDVFPVDEDASEEEQMKQANDMAWRLAQYVASLSPEEPNLGTVLVVKKVDGALPDDLSHDLWNAAQPLDIPLVGQVVFEPRQFLPSIDMVTVRALYNDQDIAWLIEWDDRLEDEGDQAVLQFPLKVERGAVKPYFLGGDTRRPVEWWQIQAGVGQVSSRVCAGWPDLEQDIPPSDVRMVSTIMYDDGRWRALITRPLASPDPARIAAFDPEVFTPFAIFAWDEVNGDGGSECSVSTWYVMRFEKDPPVTMWVYPPLAFLLVLGAEWWLVGFLRRRPPNGSMNPSKG